MYRPAAALLALSLLPLATSCTDPTGESSPSYEIGLYYNGALYDNNGVRYALMPIETGQRIVARVSNAGESAVGVKLTFEVDGDASVSPSSAVTDGNGTAVAVVTIGDTPGPIGVTARVAGADGSGTLNVRAIRRNLVLSRDSARLVVECAMVVSARVGPAESFVLDPAQVDPGVLWTPADSGIVRFEKLVGSTDYRKPIWAVVGAAPGSTRVVASIGGGGADTLKVEVVSLEEAVPGKVEVSAVRYAAVGGPPIYVNSSVYEIGGCRLPEWPRIVSSSRPEVASINADGWLVPHAAGATALAVQAGEVADSVPVEIVEAKVEPADTTIPVGGTIDYRLFVARAGGPWTRITRGDVWPESGTALKVDGLTDIVTGVAAGEATVRIRDGRQESDVQALATVRVVKPD